MRLTDAELVETREQFTADDCPACLFTLSLIDELLERRAAENEAVVRR